MYRMTRPAVFLLVGLTLAVAMPTAAFSQTGEEGDSEPSETGEANPAPETEDDQPRKAEAEEPAETETTEPDGGATEDEEERAETEKTEDEPTAADETGKKETADKETTDEETADEETADEETADEATADKETTDEETADEATADKETADEETADEETADEETAEQETAEEETTDEKKTAATEEGKEAESEGGTTIFLPPGRHRFALALSASRLLWDTPQREHDAEWFFRASVRYRVAGPLIVTINGDYGRHSPEAGPLVVANTHVSATGGVGAEAWVDVIRFSGQIQGGVLVRSLAMDDSLGSQFSESVVRPTIGGEFGLGVGILERSALNLVIGGRFYRPERFDYFMGLRFDWLFVQR